MTTAKLITTPPKGHGLLERINEKAFGDLMAGRTPDMVPVIGLLAPADCGIDKKGDRAVRYEFVRLEAPTDEHDRTMLIHQISDYYEARTSRNGQQQTLDGTGSDSDRHARYLGYVNEWAQEQGLDQAALLERWWTHYDRKFVAAPDKAGWTQVQEFALSVGAITDDVITGGDETPDPVEPVGPVFSDSAEQAAEEALDQGDDGPEDGAE